MMRVGVVLLGGFLVVACQSQAPPTPRSQAPRTPRSHTPTTAAASGTTDWGPLAVIDEDAAVINAMLGGAGELRIAARCVTLLDAEADREITLIWRDGQTAWHPDARRIVFEDGLSNTSLQLADGDRIEAGGAGSSDSPWVEEPDDVCPRDRFVVHTVSALD